MAIPNRQQRTNDGDVQFMLVHVMQTTTLFQQLPSLPRTDAMLVKMLEEPSILVKFQRRVQMKWMAWMGK